MARKRISENDLVVSTGAAGAVPSRRKAVRRGERFTQPADTAATAPANPEPLAATPYEPVREEVARLAYSYWEARGCQGGCPEEDWMHAEQELRGRGAAAIA